MSDNWGDMARCVDDWELFYPEAESPTAYLRAKEATKPICGPCPVRDRCLEYALDNREKFGIFANTTPAERDDMLRAHGRRGFRADRPECGTIHGYYMHINRREPTCEGCRAARREFRNRQRAEVGA